MIRVLCRALLVVTVGSGAPGAGADGMMVRPMSEREWARNRERAMINEPEQKAVVYFHNGKQQLIISPGFEGAPAEFAWVIPVPSRPTVKVLDGAIFHELARRTMPRPPSANGHSRMGAKAAGAPQTVQVLERKTVGAYDVSVLSASDTSGLMQWLSHNGYRIPDRARNPILAYIREKWVFVACRVKNSAASAGLRSGTLAPIHLTFESAQPVYPIRISSANPHAFSLLVYLVLPRSESGGGRDGMRLVSAGPGMRPIHQRLNWAAEMLPHHRRAHPTLAKLTREPMDIYVLQTRMDPAYATRDYVWRTRSSKPAHAAAWEAAAR